VRVHGAERRGVVRDGGHCAHGFQDVGRILNGCGGGHVGRRRGVVVVTGSSQVVAKVELGAAARRLKEAGERADWKTRRPALWGRRSGLVVHL